MTVGGVDVAPLAYVREVNVNVNVMLQTYLRAKSCNTFTTAAPWESSSVVSGIVHVARIMISGLTVESSSTYKSRNCKSTRTKCNSSCTWKTQTSLGCSSDLGWRSIRNGQWHSMPTPSLEAASIPAIQLHSVRRSLTVDGLHTVVHAFVVSRLDSCNALLYGVAADVIRHLRSCCSSLFAWCPVLS